MPAKNDVVSYSEIGMNEGAKQFLMQAPPAVDEKQAANIAQQYYDVVAQVKSLAGERDKNFLLKTDQNHLWVLKIISQSEQLAEIDVQVQVLKHLQKQACKVKTPVAVASKTGHDWERYQQGEQAWNVRAYTFLEGIPVNQVAMTYELQRAFGVTAANISTALQTFEHPILERVILWDVMRLSHLESWAQEVLGVETLDVFILSFFKHFNAVVLPKLQQLPQYAIHGDLSQSNLVVSADNECAIDGVLDFGDMVKAPRVVELGIAASYALDTNLEMQTSLQQIVAGFESVCSLDDVEKDLLMDVIVARLVQRIVITTWRAQRFPENAEYILRGTAHAKAVLSALLTHESVSSRYATESTS